MPDRPAPEWTLHIVRTDPPEGLYFVTVVCLGTDEGGALTAYKLPTTAALRDFLRNAQAHVDDIADAADAFETRGAHAYWLPRVLMTDEQVDALRP